MGARSQEEIEQLAAHQAERCHDDCPYCVDSVWMNVETPKPKKRRKRAQETRRAVCA